ncbi:MAG: FAD-dependent oxidoreductase [Oscillospiraceae bacterium]
MKVVIVGGVAGGATAAARLRRLDEGAEIVLLERGDYISYANCGLPYYIGGEITDKRDLTLQTPKSFFNRFRIDVRVGNEALSIDPAQKTVSVRRVATGETYTEHYDKLILSPGAEPVRPQLPGVDDPRIFTLRTIPDTLKIREQVVKSQVKTAVVVGGGSIGVEMAESLINVGLDVTLVSHGDHVIAPLDYDMACDIHHYIRSKGIHLLLKTGVDGFETAGDKLGVLLTGGKVCADVVILAIGVKPDSKLASDAGLSCDGKGAILVNDRMETSHEDIYAVGDAIKIVNFVTGQPGYVALAGPANKQGRIAADNICGIPSTFRGTQGSAVWKLFDMSIAVTGLNETGAKAAGIDYDKVYTFSPSHASYYPGASNMSIKLIFEKGTGRILGGQIVGFDGVDKRCDVLATALRSHLTVSDLTELELCYAPPFSSAKDPVNMAGFVAENVMTGKLRQYFWQDVAALANRSDITRLDVRTKGEYAQGHIADTVNIPLDSLRENLEALDKSKPLYVNCHSGLRSYLACRILTQNGFDCYNLAGGYRLYESATRDIPFDGTPKHACGINI